MKKVLIFIVIFTTLSATAQTMELSINGKPISFNISDTSDIGSPTFQTEVFKAGFQQVKKRKVYIDSLELVKEATLRRIRVEVKQFNRMVEWINNNHNSPALNDSLDNIISFAVSMGVQKVMLNQSNDSLKLHVSAFDDFVTVTTKKLKSVSDKSKPS